MLRPTFPFFFRELHQSCNTGSALCGGFHGRLWRARSQKVGVYCRGEPLQTTQQSTLMDVYSLGSANRDFPWIRQALPRLWKVYIYVPLWARDRKRPKALHIRSTARPIREQPTPEGMYSATRISRDFPRFKVDVRKISQLRAGGCPPPPRGGSPVRFWQAETP